MMKAIYSISLLLLGCFGPASAEGSAHRVPHCSRCDSVIAAVINDPSGYVQSFCSEMLHLSTQIAQDRITNLVKCTAASDYASRQMAQYMESYLYDIESPLHSDSLYIAHLDAMLGSNTEPALASRFTYQREVAASNLPGTQASDFSFITPGGNTAKLSGHINDGKYTLLILFEPDCEHCIAAISSLQSNSEITGAISNSALAIVAVNPEGEQSAIAPLSNAAPQGWTFGVAPLWYSEDGSEPYFMRSTPTIYLISGGGKILLKDTSPEAVAQYIQQHLSINIP